MEMSEIKTFGSHIINTSMIPDEGGVFIDAGACEGNFINEIFKLTDHPHIFALEPNKHNFRLIEPKYRGYDRLYFFEVALVGSDEPKKMRFADFTKVGLPEWGNVTGLYENRMPYHYDVHTMDIKELLSIIPNGIIHHLKMDIEGCEHKVVNDLTVDDAKRIQQISMEVHNGLQGMLVHLEEIGYDAKFENGELYAVTTW